MLDLAKVRPGGNGAGYTGKAGGAGPVGAAGFDAFVSEKTKKAENRDTVTINAGGTYEQRLEKLQKLHEETDYSGMTRLEKGQLIRGRFEQMFPDFGAIRSGIYWDGSGDTSSIYHKIDDAYCEQMGEQVFDSECPAYNAAFQQQLRGYDGMSEDEIYDAVLEKYNGGTIADRAAALWDFYQMGMNPGISTGLLSHLSEQYVTPGTEQRFGMLARSHPVRASAMIDVARGTSLSWTQLAGSYRNKMTSALEHAEDDVARRMINETLESLDKFMQAIA